MDEEFKVEVIKDEFSQYDLSFKTIVIGDPSVGKSCITMKAIKDFFEDYYAPTVGFEFYSLNVKLNDQIIKLQIWDTCGQEEYKSLISNFYRNSSLAILTYAINNKISFDNLEMWLNEVKTLCSPDVKIFLIGNKNDLEDNREVPKEKAENFSKDNKFDLFLETSAKTGFNVLNVFIEAAKILYKEHLMYKDRASRPDSIMPQDQYNQDSMSLDDNSEKRRKKKGKCC